MIWSYFQVYLESHLSRTWKWLIKVMDSTEAQLRFGAALTHSSDPQHPNHPFHTPATSMNFFLIIFFFPNEFIIFASFHNILSIFFQQFKKIDRCPLYLLP